jgi:hypothetical protein
LAKNERNRSAAGAGSEGLAKSVQQIPGHCLIALTLFLIEYRGDDADIKQVFHFLKIRWEIRGPSFHGPSFCLSFKTRSTSRPYAVVFPVCAVSLVRRALRRLAVVAVMAALRAWR